MRIRYCLVLRNLVLSYHCPSLLQRVNVIIDTCEI